MAMPNRDCKGRARDTSYVYGLCQNKEKERSKHSVFRQPPRYDSVPPMLVHDAATAGGVVVVLIVTLVHRQPKQLNRKATKTYV